MDNFSGKPGKPRIFIETCSLSSKNIMDNGQIMDWKTWNFYLRQNGHPVNTLAKTKRVDKSYFDN